MKMSKFVLAACLGFGSMSTFAATFDVINGPLDTSPVTDDGITLSFSAPSANEEVVYYGTSGDFHSTRGMGIRTGSITYADRLKGGEVLRLEFDTTFDATYLTMANWVDSDVNSLTVTTDTGASLVFDNSDDVYATNGYGQFDIQSLGAFDYLNLTGASEGVTFASISGSAAVAAVPVPAAAWLFGSALLGLTGISRRKKSAVSVSVA